jgi:PKD repeat protein
MYRRDIIKAAGLTALSGGVLIQTSTTVLADSEVISEITLPESGARGMGVAIYDQGPGFIIGFKGGIGHQVFEDGSSNGPVTLEDDDYIYPTIHATGVSKDAVYWSDNETLNKNAGEDSEVAETEMPDPIYSIATDKSDSTIWVGGQNGRIWQVDSSTLDVENTISVGDSVFGLAHDGDYLWIGESGHDSIQQYDTSEETTVATYDYPNAQDIYDYSYIDDHLWLLADGRIYETDIDKSIPNESPSALFTVSQNNPIVGDTVSFDASESDDPDGNIDSYEWDFTGDGSVDATGEMVSRSFAEAGDYTVSLTVSDDSGATATSSQTLTVAESPKARMSISPSKPEVGQEVTFSGAASSDPDGSISTYEWDLTGDGSVDTTGQEVTHTYESSGELWVTLTVVDGDDLSSETRKQIAVEATETAPESGENEEGSAEPTEESEADEPTENPTNSDNQGNSASDGSGPGFGVSSGIAGIGGALYVLKCRLGSDQNSE